MRLPAAASRLLLFLAAAPAGAAVEPVDGSAGSGGGRAPLSVTVPAYDPAQCDAWLAGVVAADADGSGGLSEEEFHAFLDGLDAPPRVAAFFDRDADSYLALPWLFKIAHKALACRCQALGLGDGCCLGEGAEIPLVGLGGAEAEGRQRQAEDDEDPQ